MTIQLFFGICLGLGLSGVFITHYYVDPTGDGLGQWLPFVISFFLIGVALLGYLVVLLGHYYDISFFNEHPGIAVGLGILCVITLFYVWEVFLMMYFL